jgi:hypothetical protein
MFLEGQGGFEKIIIFSNPAKYTLVICILTETSCIKINQLVFVTEIVCFLRGRKWISTYPFYELYASKC